MNKTDIKRQIRHCERELRDAYKNLRRWLKDPADYISNGCDAGKEWEISYASYMLGEIAALKKLIEE